jgi:hypothetical protein
VCVAAALGCISAVVLVGLLCVHHTSRPGVLATTSIFATKRRILMRKKKRKPFVNNSSVLLPELFSCHENGLWAVEGISDQEFCQSSQCLSPHSSPLSPMCGGKDRRAVLSACLRRSRVPRGILVGFRCLRVDHHVHPPSSSSRVLSSLPLTSKQ